MTTERNIIIHAGQTFELSLDYAGTAGRGQRMHIRASDAAADVIAILTHNGDANARVIYDGTDSLDITIGASVNGGWLVGANRVEWVYDIEDYDLSDADDLVIPYRGKVIVYGNRTRPEDVTPSAALPSGDGRYVRFDGVQGLTDAQKLQARENIGAGTGGSGSGDVVGPASATDDRIAAFDGTTGKLIKQGSVTATAVASHLSSTSNPHSVTAAQVGADPAGTAASAVSTHAGAADPHGDRAYADGLAANYATAAQGALADSAVQDIAAEIHAATEASIADADEMGFWRLASSALRKITWANVKAAIKTYADTLYAAVGRNVSTQHSLTGGGDLSADRTLALVGDTASPGNNKVYGTDGSGTRGWYDAASGGGSPGGSGSELQYRGGASTFSGAAGTHWDAANGRLSIGAGTSPAAMLHAQSSAASVCAGVMQGAASQTANIQDWRNSAGTVLAGVTSSGVVRSAGISCQSTSSDALITYATYGFLLSRFGYGAFIGTESTYGGIVTLRSDGAVGFASSTSLPAIPDTRLTRVGAGIFGVRANSSSAGAALSLVEQTAPSAPATNGVYIYAEDNGGGKTRLMALFASGAAQEIAIEP